MKKFCLLILLIFIIFTNTAQVSFADRPELVSATLKVKVRPSSKPAVPVGENGPPIKGARIIVINSSGTTLGTTLTNSKGEAKLPLIVNRDARFPMKEMAVVTVITVANGYNEHIDFDVPINEFNDHTGRLSVSLWAIDPKRRNEPTFTNGTFHRFTVFEMLNFYAKKIGLTKQKVNQEIKEEAPWGPTIRKNLH